MTVGRRSTTVTEKGSIRVATLPAVLTALVAALLAGLASPAGAQSTTTRPQSTLQLSIARTSAEVTSPSSASAFDDPTRDLLYACIPGNIESSVGNRAAWNNDVIVSGTTVSGTTSISGPGGGGVGACQGSMTGTLDAAGGSLSLSGTSTYTFTVPSGSAKGTTTWVTSFAVKRSSGSGPIAPFTAIDAEVTLSIKRTGDDGRTTSYSAKAPVALLLTVPGTAGPVTLKVGLACDTKALDLEGKVTCTAAPEGTGIGTSISYAWKVDGITQAGVAVARLDLADIPRGAGRRVSVTARDTASGVESAAVEVAFTRPATPGGGAGGGGGGAGPVIIIAGVAVAIALAVAALRVLRTRRPPPVPVGSGAPAPQVASQTTGPRLVVTISAATSVLTKGRYTDGQLRIMGDEADVAQLDCTCRADPPTARIIGDPSITWAITKGIGQIQPGWSMTDRFDLVMGATPGSAIIRADWADHHKWLQVTVTATATVAQPDGTTATATGVASQNYIVIGATPVARLEVSPGGPIYLDGTSHIEIVPSLFLFDALFPGQVNIVDLPRGSNPSSAADDVAPGDLLNLLAPSESTPRGDIDFHAGNVGLFFEPLDTAPAQRARFRCRLRAYESDLKGLVRARVRIDDRMRIPSTSRGAVDPIVNRHIENCIAHVGDVITEDCVLAIRPTRIRTEAVDPELPSSAIDRCSPIARVRVHLRRPDGGDIDDQDFTRDVMNDTPWELRFWFERPVNRCTPPTEIDKRQNESIYAMRELYSEVVKFETTHQVRGGCLVVVDPKRPGRYDERDVLYNHLKHFTDRRFTPMRGDDGRVEVTRGIGVPGDETSSAIRIRVKPWAEMCNHVDTTCRPQDPPGAPRTEVVIVLTQANPDPELVWYSHNAVPEDWFKLVDYAALTHEFYPDGKPDPQRCRREPCSDSPDFECHSFAWRPLARTAPGAPRVEDKQVYGKAAAEYDELAWHQTLQPGDVITFENATTPKVPPAPDHSAVVERVISHGLYREVWLRSKDKTNSIFVHKFTKDVATDWFYKQYGQVQLRYFRPKRSTLQL